MTVAATLFGPLFEVLPLEAAMPELLPAAPRREEPIVQAARALDGQLQSPELRAALWLYVDDLSRSHEISQHISGGAGAFWHGVMHRREGDFWNAKYWFRQAGNPFVLEEYEPFAFVDRVEGASGRNPLDLVQTQRREWLAMVEACLA